MQFYSNLIHQILTLTVTILYSTASTVLKYRCKDWWGYKDWAITFNIRPPSPPPPPQLRTYLFFLPLKTSIEYEFTPEEYGFTPEEFSEN